MDSFAKFYFFINAVFVTHIIVNVFVFADKKKREDLKQDILFYLLFNALFAFPYWSWEAYNYFLKGKKDK